MRIVKQYIHTDGACWHHVKKNCYLVSHKCLTGLLKFRFFLSGGMIQSYFSQKKRTSSSWSAATIVPLRLRRIGPSCKKRHWTVVVASTIWFSRPAALSGVGPTDTVRPCKRPFHETYIKLEANQYLATRSLTFFSFVVEKTSLMLLKL